MLRQVTHMLSYARCHVGASSGLLTVNNMGFLSNTSPSRRETLAVLFPDKYSVLNMVIYV
jgi:hypothetical protein